MFFEVSKMSKKEVNCVGMLNTCSSTICKSPWELKTENLIDGPKHFFVYEYAHDRTVLSIALDESCTYMVSASADHSLRLHNLKTLSTTKELYHTNWGHTDWVNKVFFTKQNEVLSGGLDGKICLWNTSGACKLPKMSETANIYDIAKYKEMENKVKEVHFKASTNTLKCKEIVAHYSTISDMKFDKQNNKCITSSYDKTLKLFDLKKMKEEQFYKGSHFAPITKFLWIENKLISADKNGSLCVFDYETNQEITNAQNVHKGNIGDMGCLYFYEYDNLDWFELAENCTAQQKNDNDTEKNKNEKEKRKKKEKENTNIITSQFLFGNKDTHLNPTNEPKTPLIITGGQTDGIISIRDLRIFKKEIQKKQIHRGSINFILTYTWQNKNYIVSCAADGYCYQFEITNLCDSTLNNFCKKIFVKEPILTARYIGNHQILVGTCYGNVLLLNFCCSHDSNFKFSNEPPLTSLHSIDEAESTLRKQLSNEISPEQNDKEQKTSDILWAYGTCAKGGINSIECTFIYNTKKLQKNEIELHSIITAGDDGCPGILFFPYKYL